MKKFLSVLSIFAVFALLSAGAVAADAYKVSTRLEYQGKVFASPTAIVKDGVPAHLKVSGKDGYQLALTVKSMREHKVQVSARLESAHGDMSPTVITSVGKSAKVSQGDVVMVLDVRPSDE